jgi:transcriptional regulator with PAS, ATPase and Fis domain
VTRPDRKSVQGITEETRRLLMNYDWPGNVRELKNTLERAMILPQAKPLTGQGTHRLDTDGRASYDSRWTGGHTQIARSRYADWVSRCPSFYDPE